MHSGTKFALPTRREKKQRTARGHHLTYFLLGTRAGQGPQPVFAGFLGDPKAKCSFLAACVPPLERSVVLTRLSKDKAKSQGAQGTLSLRAVVKLKMASVAAAEKKEVEMSSTAAEEPPRRARKAIDRSAGRLVRPSEEDPRWTPGLGPSSRVQSAE